MNDMIAALSYLRRKYVIHRDLALKSWYLSVNMKVKLGDFGSAIRMESPVALTGSFCGTLDYIAPEMACSTKYG